MAAESDPPRGTGSREPRERPVGSLGELLRRQADDAIALSGAASSAWNGRTRWLPRETGRPEPPGVAGIADWDGTIYYDRTYVLRPLEDLFAGAAAGSDAVSAAARWRAKNALAVVLHENCHLLAADPADHPQTKKAWSWPTVVLEEGATEAYSALHLNDYLDRLGVEAKAPGIRALHVETTYPLFVPAVTAVSRGLGRLTGQPTGEMLRQLVVEAGGKKYGRLGELVLDGTGLSARIPEADRPAAVERIAGTARESLGEIANLGPFLSRQAAEQLSRRVGREALRSVLLELEHLDTQYPGRELPGTMVALPARAANIVSPTRRSSLGRGSAAGRLPSAADIRRCSGGVAMR